jgi:hypothetical protein
VRPFPDSIRIEFPDHQAIVIFEMKYFARDQEQIKKFPEVLKALLEQVQKGLPQDIAALEPRYIEVHQHRAKPRLLLPAPGAHSFTPIDQRTAITLTEIRKPETTLTITKGTLTELLPPGWKIFITTADYKVHVYGESFKSLEALTHENFDGVVSTIENDPAMKRLGKNAIISRAVIQNKTVSYQDIHFLFPGDFLGLHAGGSVGVFRDKVYPEVFFKAATYFSDRFGTNRQRLELTYDLSFFSERKAEGGYATFTNSFVSFSYSRNFRRTGEARWTGLGVGYLVRSSGDYFQGKTAKIFFETSLGHPKLNLIPELYLTDDFKKAVFGMKLTYKF